MEITTRLKRQANVLKIFNVCQTKWQCWFILDLDLDDSSRYYLPETFQTKQESFWAAAIAPWFPLGLSSAAAGLNPKHTI